MKKMLCLMLTCLMLLSVCACGTQNSLPNETTTETETGTVLETKPEETETQLPSPNKYPNTTFNILYMTGHSYEMGNEVDYTADEIRSTVVSEAVYSRNSLTEALMDIQIEGTYYGGIFNTYAAQLIESGDHTYDAFLNYATSTYELAIQGYIRNLKSISTIGLENEWWDQNLVEGYTLFGDYLFMATGDICIDDDLSTQIMVFSKKIIDDSGLDSPYATVRSGDWTVDKMSANMAAVKTDLDGNGKFDQNDMWGLVASYNSLPDMVVACNVISVMIDENNMPVSNYVKDADRMTEITQALLDKVYRSNAYLCIENVKSENPYTLTRDLFAENRYLYLIQAIGALQHLRATMKDDFGVIPMPKYDKAQENYYALSNAGASMYSVPTSCRDEEMTGDILNVMGYYSVDTLTESVIANTVMYQQLRDSDSEEMLRMILKNRYVDMGLTFDWGNYRSTLYELSQYKNKNYASSMKKTVKMFDKNITDAVTALRKNMGN